MGMIRNMLNETGEMWHRMAAGDPRAFMGLPSSGTGDGGPPSSLTAQQRQTLMQCFHRQYGCYPQSDYQFQQWLRYHW